VPIGPIGSSPGTRKTRQHPYDGAHDDESDDRTDIDVAAFVSDRGQHDCIVPTMGSLLLRTTSR
jgi:hypothetical protein